MKLCNGSSGGVVVVVMCVVLVMVMVAVSVAEASTSGFYIDNGQDQTMIERVMSRQEKRQVEHEILNLLGLDNRPQRRPAPSPMRKSAPRFLLDVYKTLLQEDANNNSTGNRKRRDAEGSDGTDLNLSVEEEHAIDESDIIMTFESQNNKVSSVRHERGKRLWFNVSGVPAGETIVGAELRIFKNANVTGPGEAPDAKYTIAAYQLTHTDDGERELELVTLANTTASFGGWLELNMTAPLSTWVAFPESNKGLYLSVHPADKIAHEIRPEDIGLVSTNAKGQDENQPFMVAFFKAQNHVKVRNRRDTRSKKSEYSSTNNFKNSFADQPGYTNSKSCRIQTLYINFKDLKWQDWIIAPEGYAAHYCSGECKFPLNAHMNATNHAIVQTLVHLLNPTVVPKACCAPTKLTPISVLYFLEDTNVVLKKYKKMVVKSCGCH